MNSPHESSVPGAQPHAAVVGLQWGDEGKGKIVDLLARQYDVVVRYNGGANAGHTVVVAGERYALHLIPAGILDLAKTNVIANGVVVDPVALLQEMDHLTGRSVAVGKNLLISDRCHIVMPYHKVQDELLETVMSRFQSNGKAIGTTGRGIGPAYADKAQRATAIRAIQLGHPDRFLESLKQVVAVKNAMLEGLARLADRPFTPFQAKDLADQYLAIGQRLQGHICDTALWLHEAMRQGRSLLFEGANGCLLDIDHGTYPYVTSSNCSSLGLYPGSGVPGGSVKRIVGIAKAYTTRVGSGPFPTELTEAVGDRIRQRGKEYGTTTGRPRRCGWLDLVILRYSAAICGATELAVMLLDVLGSFEELMVCTAYEVDGKRMHHLPADVTCLERAKPIYERAEGFGELPGTCRRYDELPMAAQRYIQRIEAFVGLPVTIVSIGPERTQTLIRENHRISKP